MATLAWLERLGVVLKPTNVRQLAIAAPVPVALVSDNLALTSREDHPRAMWGYDAATPAAGTHQVCIVETLASSHRAGLVWCTSGSTSFLDLASVTRSAAFTWATGPNTLTLAFGDDQVDQLLQVVEGTIATANLPTPQMAKPFTGEQNVLIPPTNTPVFGRPAIAIWNPTAAQQMDLYGLAQAVRM